jgi:hypothetical protein
MELQEINQTALRDRPSDQEDGEDMNIQSMIDDQMDDKRAPLVPDFVKELKVKYSSFDFNLGNDYIDMT